MYSEVAWGRGSECSPSSGGCRFCGRVSSSSSVSKRKLEVIGNIMRPSRKFIGRCVGMSGRRAALSETSDRRTTTWSRIGLEVKRKQNERFRPAVDRLLSSRSRVQLTLQHQSHAKRRRIATTSARLVHREAVRHEACNICGISLQSECLVMWWFCAVTCSWVISPVRIQNAVCAMCCTTDTSAAVDYGVLSTRIFRTWSHSYSCTGLELWG